MDTLDAIAGITDAIKTLKQARKELVDAPIALWRFVDHAISHIEKEVEAVLLA